MAGPSDPSVLEDAVRAVSRINVISSRFTEQDRLLAEAKLLEEESIQTSYIEGKVLDRDSVRSSIARKLGIKSISKNSRYGSKDADGLIETLLDATNNSAQPLTHERLLRWHSSLFPTGRDEHGYPIEVGHYRTSLEDMKVVSVSAKREVIHYIAPPSRTVPKEMERFVLWFNKTSATPNFLRAAIATYWFVSIHPFEDGNGRLCRVIADMAIAQAEHMPSRLYSFSSVLMEDRASLDGYYDTLEQCQRGNKPIVAWVDFFLTSLQIAAKRSEVLLNDILGKTIFWDKCRDVELNERQRKYLNFVLDKGSFLEAKISRKHYKKIVNSISDATAKRDLVELSEKQIIIPVETVGRNAGYQINSDFL